MAWIKGWRTVLLNVVGMLIILLPEAVGFFTTVDWAEYLPAAYSKWVILGFAFANIVLRIKYTTTPFGQAEARA